MKGRLVIRASAILPTAWRDDGFGGRCIPALQCIELLAKGRAMEATPENLVGSAELGAVIEQPDKREEDAVGRVTKGAFSVGKYAFEFCKGRTGIGILTISGARLPMPYHMVVPGYNDARTRGPELAATFERGAVPREGVFRRDTPKVKFPGTSE